MKRASIAMALFSAILAAGCWGGGDNARWEEAQKETKNQPAVAKEAVKGASLNAFFPDMEEGDLSLTFEQEKDGFAMASIEHDTKDVVTLSITDLKGQAEAIAKFDGAAEKIGGYPAVADGSKGTKILVGGRFQVGVRSVDADSTAEDRKMWIESFDLKGLEDMGK